MSLEGGLKSVGGLFSLKQRHGMWHVRVSFQKPAALCICHTHIRAKLSTIKSSHVAAEAERRAGKVRQNLY